MHTDFLHHGQGNLPKSFFKQGIVGDFDDMFSQMSTAKFTGLLGEDTMVLSQERSGGIHQLRCPGFQSLKSNSSNKFPCLCFMVSFGIWRPWVLPNASILPVHIGDSGTCVAATAVTTGIFFHRVWKMPYYFSLLQ